MRSVEEIIFDRRMEASREHKVPRMEAILTVRREGTHCSVVLEELGAERGGPG